jgi:hypothetical protein
VIVPVLITVVSPTMCIIIYDLKWKEGDILRISMDNSSLLIQRVVIVALSFSWNTSTTNTFRL